MCRRLTYYAPAVLLLSLFLCMSACRGRTEEELNPSDPAVPGGSNVATVVYQTDSTEWIVSVFRTGVLASDSYSVPEPYHIPTHEEASVLRHIEYGDAGIRYLTDDGYTFGMPSASVSKAGQKTKYTVLGLYIRATTIVVTF